MKSRHRRWSGVLLAVVGVLVALLWPGRAAAALDVATRAHLVASAPGDSRPGLDATIASCTYRLSLAEPRLVSGSPRHELRRASGPSLRWKGRPREVLGATSLEVYDMRARQWVPELGAFLSIDEYQFHDPKGTLWSWPNQNPLRYADPSGRCGPLCVALGVAGLIVAYGTTLASDDAAAQRAAHPELVDTPSGFMAGANMVIAPVAVADAIVGPTVIGPPRPPVKEACSAERIVAKDVRDVLQQLPSGSSSRTKLVRSPDELNALFEKLSQGGAPTNLPNYQGQAVKLSDGTIVGLRSVSKSGGETVDIFAAGGGSFKIHVQ